MCVASCYQLLCRRSQSGQIFRGWCARESPPHKIHITCAAFSAYYTARCLLNFWFRQYIYFPRVVGCFWRSPLSVVVLRHHSAGCPWTRSSTDYYGACCLASTVRGGKGIRTRHNGRKQATRQCRVLETSSVRCVASYSVDGLWRSMGRLCPCVVFASVLARFFGLELRCCCCRGESWTPGGKKLLLLLLRADAAADAGDDFFSEGVFSGTLFACMCACGVRWCA